MSGIGTPVARTEAPKPVEPRHQPDRDGKRQPHRQKPPPAEPDMVEVETHTLDLEA